MSTTPWHRTARALYPHRPELWEPEYLYEPLPAPVDHPELDLFGARRSAEMIGVDPDASVTTAADKQRDARPLQLSADPLPARMLNEFVYCPRLFYYEHVEGVFVKNADTERGSALHEKVDRGRGSLPRAKKRGSGVPPEKSSSGILPEESGSGILPDKSDSGILPDTSEPGILPASTPKNESNPASATGTSQPAQSETPDAVSAIPNSAEETIHSRSAMLSSERLGVVAKMDLIEVKVVSHSPGDDLFAPRHIEVQSVTPVDYKAGAPRRGEDANELWDADKMQLGLQILILRDNGYACEQGVIYYRATKQRVPLVMTPEIEAWIIDRIAAARRVSASPIIPPPLVNSPKCVRCSLAPVCLPDETRWLAAATTGNRSSLIAPPSRSAVNTATAPPRRLIAARDDERALYLNTQGCRVGLKSERLIIKDGDCVVDEVRMNDVTHVALFGNIQISTQTVQELCEHEIPVAYFSMGGWFYGLTRGHGLKNVHTRIRQFATAANPLQCLAVAQQFVRAKIRNHRTMLMRLHVQPPKSAVIGLKEIARRVSDARGLDELLGMEGAAAALYFQHFAGMIKAGEDDPEDEIPGLEASSSEKKKRKTEAETFTFDFTQRRRRPPTDPVNALLSLAYSLLAKDCTIAALAVGFDPYVGFYHQPRHGRPALALDLMEEFRPLVAESAVLTAINNRMITPGHFVRAGNAVNLTPQGRKAFFHAYEQRMNTLITHPVFDYKVSYRRVLELQARLLARWLTGEIPDYVPMVTR